MFDSIISNVIVFNIFVCIFKDGGTFPLFNKEWTAEEEVLLLDAIEQHGFGNWYVMRSLNPMLCSK